MLSEQSSIRAVIFDRDGVLTHFDMPKAIEFFQPLIPLNIKELGERWTQWGDKVGFPNSLDQEKQFWLGFWQSLVNEFDLPPNVHQQLNNFDYTSIVVAFEDALPSLSAIRQQKLKIGVLSNFTLASLEASLDTAGLLSLVDVACAAPVIGFSKPDIRAYHHVANLLHVQPEECLFFDDEPDCVQGAVDAGMTAYWVRRNATKPTMNEHTVHDLLAITNILNTFII